jgi:hypothetical protein
MSMHGGQEPLESKTYLVSHFLILALDEEATLMFSAICSSPHQIPPAFGFFKVDGCCWKL